MLNANFLKGYMSGIIAATNNACRACELATDALSVAAKFDCDKEDVKTAKAYLDYLITLLYGD